MTPPPGPPHAPHSPIYGSPEQQQAAAMAYTAEYMHVLGAWAAAAAASNGGRPAHSSTSHFNLNQLCLWNYITQLLPKVLRLSRKLDACKPLNGGSPPMSPQQSGGRGLHSSTFQVNLRSFCR